MKTFASDYDKDEQLITKYLESKDNNLLGILYEKYYAFVYNICLQITKKRADALDLTQEVFMKAFDKIETLNNRLAFASWLLRISRNMCINYLKNKQVELFYDTDYFINLADRKGNLEEELKKEDLHTFALASIEELPEMTRQILTLKYLKNYSLKQLEQKFLLGESAVKMRLSRAKKILKLQLEKESSRRMKTAC